MFQLANYGEASGIVMPELSLADSATSASNATTYNFGTMSFGAEDPNRYLIVSFAGLYSQTAHSIASPLSVTIGGSSWSEYNGNTLADGDGVIQPYYGGFGWDDLAGVESHQYFSYIVKLPTGTSGTVSVTYSVSMSRAMVHVIRLVHATGIPFDADSIYSASKPPAWTGKSLLFPANGVGFLSMIEGDDNATTTYTPTLSGVTADSSPTSRATIEAATVISYSTYWEFTSGGTPVLNVVSGENGYNYVGFIATYGPERLNSPFKAFCSATDEQNVDSSASSTTKTWTGVSFGAAAPDGYDRYIFVAISQKDAGTTARTVNSVTIDGNTATITDQVNYAPSNNISIAHAFYGPLNTGTSGDVVATYDTASTFCGLRAHRILVPKGKSLSAYASDSVNNGDAEPRAMTFSPGPMQITFHTNQSINGNSGMLINRTAAHQTSALDIDATDFINGAFYSVPHHAYGLETSIGVNAIESGTPDTVLHLMTTLKVS